MKLTAASIMATYNGSQFISDQLQSIYDQKIRPDQVIIRDDRSSDDTARIVEQFISSRHLEKSWDFKINPIRKGWRQNFIQMISQTKTDVIFYTDQDDLWHEDKVSDYLNCFSQNNGIEALVSDYSFIPKNQNILPMAKIPESGQGPLYKVIPNLFNLLIRRDGCTLAFRKTLIPFLKEVFQKVSTDSNGLPQSHDQATWLSALLRGSLYHLHKPLLYRRAHQDSTWQREMKSHPSHFIEDVDENPNFLAYLKMIRQVLMGDHLCTTFANIQLEREIQHKIADFSKLAVS
ncbi:MAG: glycosyltransferase [Oenococcus sp.]|uniref:glycosyltransferase n=1 Tax=Oenococcus sp. TaxID=1979414 RepID=UPI0039EB82FE